MLLGRANERLALDRLIAQARDGRSGVLALAGEPGIGKTALLDYAAEQAEGMRVLRARGIESEAEIPFAGLAELLRPVLGGMEQIPAPQAAALASALALGPARAGDRFAIGAATLSLLSASADDAPLLLVVDDAHWLDSSSADALLFAARRLVADAIAVVIAAREGEPSLLDGAGLRVLRLAGLDRTDAATLLAAAGAPDEAVERLVRATGGNPLALLELAADGRRLATAPATEPVPISTSITRAFARRFARLPAATRRALVLVAADDGGHVGVLVRAGLDLSVLEAAEEARLITLDGATVAFTHPLARAALYAEATGPERRAAHAALAAALPDHDVDRRAWHLAAASRGPDARAASALEQAGARARDRSAYAVAASAFQRAAGLAPGEDMRGGLLVTAADAAWLAGDMRRTLSCLDGAQPYARTDSMAAGIDHLRGLVAMRRGPVMAGYRLVVGAAQRVERSDREGAVVMLAEAVRGCFYAGATRPMVTAALRARELAEPDGSPRARFLAAAAAAMAMVADGQGEAGVRAARQAVAILEPSDELGHDPTLLFWAAIGALWLREAGAGRAAIERASAQARAQSAVGVLPSLLHILARDQATTDRWPAAEASYDESIRLARETGQRVELGAALAGLAWLEARQGRAAACREHAAQAAALCDELGANLYGVWAIQAVGDLELGLGHVTDALARHEAQAAALERHGIADVDLSPGPELVDEYLRLGRDDDAAREAAVYAKRAAAKGQPWALARAARCRGLLAAPEAMEAAFDEALVLHARTPDVFEAARTRLAFGARLRRARRRVRAREELVAALETFERLGARPWADRADAELAASGETARRREASTIDDLTPQELQIARLLADGRTTKQTAAALFVSPKTVEYHLRHVYDKLGIRSRQELAAALGA